MKVKFNNDEFLLATILGAIDKIDLDKALANKDFSFKENVYTILNVFTAEMLEKVEASKVIID